MEQVLLVAGWQSSCPRIRWWKEYILKPQIAAERQSRSRSCEVREPSTADRCHLTQMTTLHRATSAILTVVLNFVVAFDFLFAVELLEHLFSGGLSGVNRWIIHITTEGSMEFVSEATIYRRFAATCVFLSIVTAEVWWGRRLLRRKATTSRAA